MKWIILALTICVAGLSVAVFLNRGEPISAVRQAPVIQVSTSTITEETSAYSIKADYPVFGIPALDARIKEVIDEGIADIKSTATASSSEEGRNEFVSLFQNPYIGEEMVSVELILSEYTGGAHGLATAVGINYDVSSGTFLTLDDALALTGKPLPQVAAIAERQLKLQFGSIQFEDGISPIADNYQTFILDKDSVKFIFQEYQAEAYAAGMPTVSIPRIEWAHAMGS